MNTGQFNALKFQRIRADTHRMSHESMKTICAHCRTHLAGNPTAPRTSHGICPQCLATAHAELAHLHAAHTSTNAIQRPTKPHGDTAQPTT